MPSRPGDPPTARQAKPSRINQLQSPQQPGRPRPGWRGVFPQHPSRPLKITPCTKAITPTGWHQAGTGQAGVGCSLALIEALPQHTPEWPGFAYIPLRTRTVQQKMSWGPAISVIEDTGPMIIKC